MNKKDAIEQTKLAFEFLKKSGLNAPHFYLAETFKPSKESYPFILRQSAGGARSMNKFLIKNTNDWDTALSRIGNDISNYIVTEFIDSEEYTCGSVFVNGSCFGVIAMQRILRGGETYKCFTVKNDAVEEEVRKILEVLKPFGAFNVEMKLKNGEPHVFEINARCSGTTAARACSGARGGSPSRSPPGRGSCR